jgi:hypothetical protein
MPKEVMENKTLKVKVVIKETITQADLEAFQTLFWKEKTDIPALSRSANIRAALASGWIEDLTIDDKKPKILTGEEVGQMDPRVVMFICEKIDALYREFTTVPKN